VAGLIVTTILSGVAAGVVAWKSGMKLPVSFTIIHRDSPQMEASTVSHALETVLPKQDVLIPRVALTAPISLDATAGQEVPFALTLDSAEPLPSRSTLVISGLVAAPCGAPIMASVLTWVTQTKSGTLGFVYLFSFSLGMCALLVGVGLSSGALARLPRSGVWMNWVKKGFGFLMLVVAEYYLVKMGQLII
jgi:cytochrome c biogenesis protein CcdA